MELNIKVLTIKYPQTQKSIYDLHIFLHYLTISLQSRTKTLKIHLNLKGNTHFKPCFPQLSFCLSVKLISVIHFHFHWVYASTPNECTRMTVRETHIYYSALVPRALHETLPCFYSRDPSFLSDFWFFGYFRVCEWRRGKGCRKWTRKVELWPNKGHESRFMFN